MSAERAALRIVKLAKLGTEQTGKPFGSDIMADIGQTASIIREETRCDQLAEALEDVESILPTGDDWEADGIRVTKKMARKIRAVLARARGEG